MAAVAIVLAAFACCNVLHTVIRAAAGKALGADVLEVAFFSGPELIRFRLLDTDWLVKILPWSSYVKFRNGDDGGEATEDRTPRPGLRLDDLSLPARVLIFASSNLALIATALACLGPARGLESFRNGFGQIFRGAAAPIAVGEPLVRALFEVCRDGRFLIVVGIVASKMAAFNLLPLPPLDGGQILMSLLGWFRPSHERVLFAATYVGLVISLTILACWAYAVVRVMMLDAS